MKFIEALKLKSKLFFLFALITMALVVIGFMGSLYIQSMKKNMDALYFGSLVPVYELNEIVNTYNINLAGTIYKASRSEISPSEISTNLENALFLINRKWKTYESHFKRDEEMQYVNYTATEIHSVNYYFSRVLQAVLDGKDLKNISIQNLEKKIEHINSVVQKLIHYEIKVAKYERKKFLNKYSISMKQLGIILSAIILAILIISYNVFVSIQIDHTKLEIVAKKLKKANKKLEHVSYVDSLTSLHNRRYFNHIYDKELKLAKREKSYITFMMLDIDYFKQYNDTYGHIEGDAALKAVAKVLKDRLRRPNDYVFRLGGEEFGVLLTRTDETNSARLAREICDTLRAKEIIHEGSLVNQYLTISIGVVCCVADAALDDEVLMSRADEMLYKAKEGGRDSYTITTNVSNTTPQKNDEQQQIA